MDGLQKRTFLPYLRGVLPQALRLGSLYLNPLEPSDGLRKHRFEYMREEDDQAEYERAVRKWTRGWVEEDQSFFIKFEAVKARSLGFSFTNLINFEGGKNDSTWVSIQGQSSRRVKINDPEQALEDVMKQPGVHKWICEHASIEHKSLYGGKEWKAPKIWMVTGLQYVTGGTIHSESSASHKVAGSASADASLAVNTRPGTFQAKAEAKHEKTNGSSVNFDHQGERVWAAQFMPVSIEYGFEEDGVSSTSRPKTIAHFELQEVEDLKARGTRDYNQKRDNRPGGPVPNLIGRITVPQSGKSKESENVGDDLVIDDTDYVTDVKETDWDTYNKCKIWFRDLEADD